MNEPALGEEVKEFKGGGFREFLDKLNVWGRVLEALRRRAQRGEEGGGAVLPTVRFFAMVGVPGTGVPAGQVIEIREVTANGVVGSEAITSDEELL